MATFGETIEETFFPAMEAILEEGATPEEALTVAQGETVNYSLTIVRANSE